MKKDVSGNESSVDADIFDRHTMKINGILGSQLHVSYQILHHSYKEFIRQDSSEY